MNAKRVAGVPAVTVVAIGVLILAAPSLGQPPRSQSPLYEKYEPAPAVGIRPNLKLERVVARCHSLSPPRADADYCPGETVLYTLDITGLKEAADRSVAVETAVRLSNAADKEVFFATYPQRERTPQLGLRSVRIVPSVDLPRTLPPGTYTFQARFKDLTSGEEAAFERRVRVKPSEFTLASAVYYADEGAQAPLAPAVLPGQKLWLKATYVGFGLDERGARISGRVWFTDAQTKEVLCPADEVTIEAPKVSQRGPIENVFVTVSFSASRVGEFIVHFRMTDLISKKTVESEIPLRVLPSE
jgi:hypothetical protein